MSKNEDELIVHDEIDKTGRMPSRKEVEADTASTKKPEIKD